MSERLGGSRHPCHGWMAQQGTQRPYEDQPASLQRWGWQGCTVTYQSWHWDLTVYHYMLGARITPFSPMPFIPYKVIWGSWWGVQGQTSPWMMSSPYWMSTTTMSRLWMLWIRNSFSYEWVRKMTVSDWGCACWDTSRFSWCHSQNVPPRPHSQAEAWLVYTVDSLNGLKQWWPTWKPAPMKRCIPIISGQQGRLRRKRWWNHL